MINLKIFRRVLTFFAHPDDETLAAGATISKLTHYGVDVHIAIPATGIHSRRNLSEKNERDISLISLRKDCEKAMSVLGIPPANIYLGEFADNEMDKFSLLEIVHWFEKILNKVKPDLILTHHRFCTNIDHRYCHEAAVIATRPSYGSNNRTILCGEVPSSTGYLRPAQWEPNCYIEVSESNLELKIKAMQTFENEARKDPHPRSPEVLKALAKVRGSESGFYYAESFMIQKIMG